MAHFHRKYLTKAPELHKQIPARKPCVTDVLCNWGINSNKNKNVCVIILGPIVTGSPATKWGTKKTFHHLITNKPTTDLHSPVWVRVGQTAVIPSERLEIWMCLFLYSEPPKRGRKTDATRKLSKSVENIFDAFWRFLTFFWRFFALREKCWKVSKIFWKHFDDFWCGPFPLAPFAVRWYMAGAAPAWGYKFGRVWSVSRKLRWIQEGFKGGFL